MSSQKPSVCLAAKHLLMSSTAESSLPLMVKSVRIDWHANGTARRSGPVSLAFEAPEPPIAGRPRMPPWPPRVTRRRAPGGWTKGAPWPRRGRRAGGDHLASVLGDPERRPEHRLGGG